MAKLFSPRVGVLALQGDVFEHVRALELCGAETILVKNVDDLQHVHGLILPGGESTTIGKLLTWTGLDEAIRNRVKAGMPVYGTCAGAILLSKTLVGSHTAPHLKLMDITVERNAYGRQLDSFETFLTVDFPNAPQSIPAVFIRAPKIPAVGPTVKVLSRHENEIIMAQEGHRLVTTFHPELTEDLTVHHYFLELIHHAQSA